MTNSLFNRRTFVVSSAAAAARVLGANDRIQLGLIGTGGRATDHAMGPQFGFALRWSAHTAYRLLFRSTEIDMDVNSGVR